MKRMEERLMKKSQADEDDDYMCVLMSLLPSLKILYDFQILELRI